MPAAWDLHLGAGKLRREEMSSIFSFGRIIQTFPTEGNVLGMTTFAFVHVVLSLIGAEIEFRSEAVRTA
jgi:hypothetical protein